MTSPGAHAAGLVGSSGSGALGCGESLAISIPRTEAAVIKYFQARMPYGLVVPDIS
jgi:hypothetical protein